MPPDPYAVDAFIKALEHLEQTRDVEPMVALFAEGCEVSNVNLPGKLHGREGARSFWKSYRANFHEMQSTFQTVIGTDGKAALEWRTRGSTREGAHVEYEGMSLLAFDDDGAIVRFMAYFDPTAIGRAFEARA